MLVTTSIFRVLMNEELGYSSWRALIDLHLVPLLEVSILGKMFYVLILFFR